MIPESEEDRTSRKKYEEYARKVIELMKNLGPECRQSGDDSPLEDVWEEFKFQVQYGESVVWEAYEETILGLCEMVVKELPNEEIELLWPKASLETEYSVNDKVNMLQKKEAVKNRLYSEVCFIAGGEDVISEHEYYSGGKTEDESEQ